MLCLAALIIFAVIGIFSATHRKLAWEAWECVLNRVRRRPCEASLGERVKTDLVAWLMPRNMRLAKFINRRAEILAWALVTLSIISALYVARGVFYLVTQGTCNPGGECFFNLGKDELDNIEQQLRQGY